MDRIDLIYKLNDYHEALRREKRFKEADFVRNKVKIDFGIEIKSYKNGWSIPHFSSYPEKFLTDYEESLIDNNGMD